MKKLILILVIGLGCSLAFAGPEKDGPFPKAAVGIWGWAPSNNGPANTGVLEKPVYYMALYIAAPHQGKQVVSAILTDSKGRGIASGHTVILAGSSVAQIPILFENHRGVLKVSAFVDQGGGNGYSLHLRVVMVEDVNKGLAKDLIFSRLP